MPPQKGDPAPPATWDPAVSGPAGSHPPEVTLPVGDVVHDGAGTESGPRYTREGLLGKGGMGIVYMAQDHRLGRVVALKEAARGGETAARLAREARVTAGLEHPGIVTVHDTGVTEDGRPFYTMRLVRGRPLSSVLGERRTLVERQSLVRHYLDACNALGYAHAQGVVHRDVKPANIMVGGFGETQVVDWGLAARIGAPGGTGDDAGPEDATRTRTGAVLGTPAYMSPEQARGEFVGAQADVWSLGAVLYELLSGEPPRGKGTSDEVLARARTGTQSWLRTPPDAPAELVAITERALAPDPAARYPDAGALAADVAAWLDGHLVGAHAYTPWELLVRLVRAWRAPLIVGGVATLLLVGLVAAGTWRLTRERDRVVAAEKDVRAALVTSDANLAQALIAQARVSMDARRNAAAAVMASRAVALEDSPEAWGVLAGVATEARGERVGMSPLPPCTRHLLVGMGDVVCVTPRGVSRVVGGEVQWTWSGPPGGVHLDPNHVYVAEGDGVVALDLATGAAEGGLRRFGFSGAHWWPVRPADWGEPDVPLALHRLSARFCPGSRITNGALAPERGIWAGVCADGRVANGPIGVLPARYLPTPVTHEAFSGVIASELTPDGRHLVLGGTKGGLAIVDLATGRTQVAVTLARDATVRLAISADGTRLAVAGDRGEVEVRTLPDLAPLVYLPIPARDVRFLPDGTLLVASAETMSRWRLPPEHLASVLRGPDGLTAAVFSPDGRSLATAHGRLQGLIWEVPSGRRRAALDIGAGTAKGVAFTPDGAVAWFAMTGPDGAWRPEPLRVDGGVAERLPDGLLLTSLTGHRSRPARRIVLLHTGVLLAVAYVVGEDFALDTRTYLPVPLQDCPLRLWIDAGQAPGGEHAVLVDEAGLVAMVEPGPPLRCGRTFTVEGAGAVDVDAAGAVVVGLGDTIVRMDAAGVEQWRAPSPGGRVLDVAVSADGRWIAAGGTDHLARVWDATGRLRAVLAGHTERVASVDFRPDGHLLATGSWDGTARLWGLDVLDAAPAALDAQAPTAWGLTLAEALPGR